MRRKDLVYAAILINVSLLALLFAFASPIFQEDMVEEDVCVVEQVEEELFPSPVAEDALDQVVKASAVQEEEDVEEMEYYTMQPGDNPWKLAKRFGVKFEELVRMNDLDDAKARGLRPGSVLRVR